MHPNVRTRSLKIFNDFRAGDPEAVSMIEERLVELDFATQLLKAYHARQDMELTLTRLARQASRDIAEFELEELADMPDYGWSASQTAEAVEASDHEQGYDSLFS